MQAYNRVGITDTLPPPYNSLPELFSNKTLKDVSVQCRYKCKIFKIHFFTLSTTFTKCLWQMKEVEIITMIMMVVMITTPIQFEHSYTFKHVVHNNA
jgi:hypothetical protein